MHQDRFKCPGMAHAALCLCAICNFIAEHAALCLCAICNFIAEPMSELTLHWSSKFAASRPRVDKILLAMHACMDDAASYLIF